MKSRLIHVCVGQLRRMSCHALAPITRRTRFSAAALTLALLVAFASLLAQQANAAGPITVTTTADEDGTNAGACSLREAITAANTDAAYGGCPAGSGADTINVPPGTYTLTLANAGGVNEDNNATGDLDVNADLTIQGAGAGATIIQAGTNTSNGIDKVIAANPTCASGVNVTVNGVTVRYGRNTQPWGAADYSFTGGGIDWCAGGTGGIFSLSNSVVSDNTNVNGYGGGLNVDTVSSPTTVNITNVSFQNNRTLSTVNESNGGAINLFGDQPTINITNSTFSGNLTTNTNSAGGAIYFRPTTIGSLTISSSTFSSNTAAGSGGAIATSTYGAGTTVSIQTSLFTGNTATASFGGALDLNSTNLNTTPFSLSHLKITGNTAGNSGGGVYVGNSNVTMSKSLIVGNSAPTGSGIHKSVDAATATVSNNWWGCSTGPGAPPCDTATISLPPPAPGGTLIFTPWYRDQLTATTSTIVTNQSTALTASFLTNSAGSAVPVADLAEIIGRSVSWAATNGNLSGTQGTVQAAGTATGSFQATAAGTAVISAKVDNDSTTGAGSNIATITINKANTTTVITTDTPDPSVTNQPVTVSYSVTGAFGNSPTSPTGNVLVTDGTDSCTGTVAAGSCSITFGSAGAKTITATYQGDSNFNASPASAGVAHTVNKADTTAAITSDTPDPSITNEAVAVNYTVTGAFGNSPTTPTGNVTVSDGVDSCIGTVAAGTCSITLTTPGARTLTATYAGDSNFNASPASADAAHSVRPIVIDVTSNTANGAYTNPTVIDVRVTFNEAVNVTGTPKLTLETGTADRDATYVSGSGTSTLVFNYTIQDGDTSSDLDYISTSALALNGGTIQDADAIDASLSLPSPGAAGSLGANKNIIIDTTEPTVTNITSSSTTGCLGSTPQYCNAGDSVSIQVTFSEVVNVTGTPQLALNSGGTASYSSGSGTNTLTFTYIVASGENASDLDYTSSGALTLNGGTIQDAATNNATLTLASPGASGSLGFNADIVVDTTAPTIISFTRFSPATSPTNADTLTFRVLFSEKVFGIGNSDFAVNGTTTAIISGVGIINSNGLYEVTIAGGDLASFNGVVGLDFSSAAAMTDAAGNAFVKVEPATDETYTVDNTAPTVTINQAAGQADPANGSPINFTIIFDKPVTGFATGGVTLTGTAGATTGTVTEIAPNDGTTYNVAVSGMTGDGSVIASIAAGAAQDAATNGNSASTSTDNSVTYDATTPTVTGVTSPSANGSYTAGAVIPIVVTFSEPVTVAGTPQLTLETGTTDEVVDYTSGSGTSTLTFNYTVQAGDSSPDLDYISTTAVALNGGTIKDAAANNATLTLPAPGAAGSLGANKDIVVDTVAPDTILDAPLPANPTNNPAATFTFHGNDGTGSGVASFECQLDGGGFSACTSPNQYSGLADGSHTFQVQAIDAAGNVDPTPASYIWTVDTTAPTVAMSSIATDPTNVSPIPVTVILSENVTGFTAADITTGNGTVNNFAGSGTTYTFDLVPAGQGLVTADIAAGAAVDAAGNGNTAATQFSRTYDSVGPSVTISQAAAQTDPTSIAPVNFTVAFDEPVASFIAANVTLGGTAPGTLSATISGGPATYNVAVSGMTGAGTVTAGIAAGAVTDLAGNPNTASTSADNSVTFDPVVPVVTGIVRAGPSPTSAASVQFTVTFSKNVSGVDASDFTLTTSGVTGASITSVEGSGTTWTVTVDTGTGDGTIRLDLTDNDTIVDGAGNSLGGLGAGNGNFTGGQVYVIDKTAPSVLSIVRANTDPTNAATVDFTVTFSEPVTGVDSSDFSLTVSGVTGAAITNVIGSGSIYTVTVNTGSGSGTLGLNLADDDSIVDVIGNQLGGKGAGNGDFTGQVYTVDKTAPQAGSLSAANIITGGGTNHSFTVVFSDNLAIDIASLDANDIRITGPNGFDQLATFSSVAPSSNGTPRTATYQISAPGGTWDIADNGAYTITILASQVRDTAGNTVVGAVLGSFTVNISTSSHILYLPLILHSVAQAPDLVVTSVTLSPNKTSFTTSEPVQISVVIKNQGSAPTTPFWVDLYLNPSRTPALNLIWSQVCGLKPCYGIAWQVVQPLAPGASLTLTSTVGSYAQNYTNWLGRLAAGTTDLYVQADSWNPGKTIGASGDASLANNLFHISGLRVTGQNLASAGTTPADIPARPAAGQR